MKETESRTGRHLRRYRNGFASAWFLSLFLSLCVYSAILADNIRNRSEVILNLKREQEYYLAEYPRVREVMCRLQQERNRSENDAEETAEQSGDVPENGSLITIEIAAPYPETVLLTIDQNTMKVMDCISLRSENSSHP